LHRDPIVRSPDSEQACARIGWWIHEPNTITKTMMRLARAAPGGRSRNRDARRPIAAYRAIWSPQSRGHRVGSRDLLARGTEVRAVSLRRIWLQLVKESGQRIARRAIAPHNFKRRPDRSRVIERSDEDGGDIRPSDPIANRQREGALCYKQRMLIPRTVEQDPGSDDAVLESAAANLVLRALTPDQRITLVEVEEHRGPGMTRHTTGGHIQKATAASHALSCGQGIHDALILGFSNVRLRRGTTTAATRGKHDMSRTLEGAGNRVLLRDIAGHELEGRSEPCPRALRVPGKDTDWYTLTLQVVHNEKARASSTADY